MLTIDRFCLHLPAKCRSRAHRIARMVADELALLPAGSDARIDRMSVLPITIAPGAGDRQIARQIATAVKTHLNGKGTGEPQDLLPHRRG